MNKHFSIGLCRFRPCRATLRLWRRQRTSTSTTAAPATESAAASASESATATASDSGIGRRPQDRTVQAGQIVVDGKGMSVYYFTKDTKDSGTSACTGGCLTPWPPVTTTSRRPSGRGRHRHRGNHHHARRQEAADHQRHARLLLRQGQGPRRHHRPGRRRRLVPRGSVRGDDHRTRRVLHTAALLLGGSSARPVSRRLPRTQRRQRSPWSPG